LSDLTDLPNIGQTLADKLDGIGVSNREQLAALGSVEAIIKIGAADASGCYNMLYALEGAIQGIRWHALSQPVREELRRRLDVARKR